MYDIKYHWVSFTSEDEIAAKIVELSKANPDIICVSRGGGEIVEIFDKPKIAETAVGLNCAIVSAVGHEVNKPLFEKIADKSFITPTAFGQYLKEFYNNTIQDFEQSKAKLVEDVTRQLQANYHQQIANLNQQITAEKELKLKSIADKESLFTKTIAEAKILHTTEVEALKKQIESIQNQFKIQVGEKEKVLAEKEKNLATRISSLIQEKEEKDRLLSQARSISLQFQSSTDALQKQVATFQSSNTKTIAVAATAALVLGLLFGLLSNSNCALITFRFHLAFL